MTFNDIFKSSFLESVSEFSLLDTLIGLAAALVIGFIFLINGETSHRRPPLHRQHQLTTIAADPTTDRSASR